MKKNHLSVLSLLMLSASPVVFAQQAHIAVSGSVSGLVPIYQAASGGFSAAPVEMKQVKFERIVLSSEAKKYLAKQASNISTPLAAPQTDLPSQVQNGMNNVPVLDQGQHGTCVTFAVTAGLDAAYSQQDYISQLCNLELGSYLNQQDSKYDSGWDGAWNDEVLGQAQKYGVVPKTYQVINGCAGVHLYPRLNENNHGNPISADDFTQHSTKILEKISWKQLLNHDNALSDKTDMDQVLTDTKQSLVNGNRVVFGMLLDESYGQNGAMGSYKASYDSWVLTPEIQKDAQDGTIQAGHALVFTGYDDNAVITDTHGKKHQGVLTLRNSWGASAGNAGTYYMSYDYFKVMVLEAEEILSTPAV